MLTFERYILLFYKLNNSAPSTYEFDFMAFVNQPLKIKRHLNKIFLNVFNVFSNGVIILNLYRNSVMLRTNLNTTLIDNGAFDPTSVNCADLFDNPSTVQKIYLDTCRATWPQNSKPAFSIFGVCEYVEGGTTVNTQCAFPFR